jgi:hypothetical protein
MIELIEVSLILYSIGTPKITQQFLTKYKSSLLQIKKKRKKKFISKIYLELFILLKKNKILFQKFPTKLKLKLKSFFEFFFFFKFYHNYFSLKII